MQLDHPFPHDPAGIMTRSDIVSVSLALAVLLPTAARSPLAAQVATGEAAAEAPASQAPRITVSFEATPIQDVLSTFARFANRSIVMGAGVDGTVSAQIHAQPWDVALQAILEAHGLSAQESESGIIRVDAFERLQVTEDVEPLVTRTIPLRYLRVEEMEPVVRGLLSARGSVSSLPSRNTLVVTDVPRVVETVVTLIRGPQPREGGGG